MIATFARWRAACLALIVTLVLTACGSSVELMAAMPEAEANEVLAALLESGIKAEKIAGKEGMVGLSIDKDSVAKAVEVLRARGLPKERFARMGEVFKKEGLISSPLEERARYLWALSQELSSTLSQIDGVLTARVHVVLPERSADTDTALPSSAAVFIRHQESYSLDGVIPQIKRLVTNSIPGLSTDKVSVVLVPAQASNLAGTSKVSMAEAFGFKVSPESAGTLKAVLISLIVLLLAALGGAGWLAWRYIGRDYWQTRQATQSGKADH
ncbi:type III secretion system inner membrane ring lipoprotein SctJ [Parachitinimonas caeni]|uniref:Lipoprotein n=1 Tax=Parachitinimonas caeni TaxID=3031301 RepID=A0ABT7DU44_9NEIS|nr:type III secretion inner membrane ring lipoprotein SctJ [Parachitinimonas caeni]MDK2123494.1 type III secretion inner membrane ring lipoprotein SctJ [Parachitinimonas caeni]